MTKEQVIQGYLMNSPKVVAEMLYDTIEKYENRSCDNCKHNKEQDNFMIFCDAVACQDGSKMMWHSFTKDFCCNKWKSKNENL